MFPFLLLVLQTISNLPPPRLLLHLYIHSGDILRHCKVFFCPLCLLPHLFFLSPVSFPPRLLISPSPLPYLLPLLSLSFSHLNCPTYLLRSSILSPSPYLPPHSPSLVTFFCFFCQLLGLFRIVSTPQNSSLASSFCLSLSL